MDHGSREHALLSASGASRWLNCTPSPRLEDEMGEEEQSFYAAEGTLAHELGDTVLRFETGVWSKKQYNKELKRIRGHELYTDEMEDQVEKYTSYVLQQWQAAKREDKDALLLVEQRVDYSHWVPGGFGTGDATIVANKFLEVVDLKYGKGVAVEADDNPQLKLYGLGTLFKHEVMWDIHTVRLTIVQPRLDSISSWPIQVDKLEDWAENEVAPKAKMAWEGKGDLNPGDHCRWCKAKPRCPALAEANVALAQHEFKEPELLTDEEVLAIYKQIPQLEGWAKAISAYLLQEAINGKDWEGYKLVEGRSQRRWSDEENAIKKLKKEGYKEKDITTRKLLGITKMEKLVKKKNFEPLLGDFVEKPPGSPTLVPEDDKRPALGNEKAAEEFKQ